MLLRIGMASVLRIRPRFTRLLISRMLLTQSNIYMQMVHANFAMCACSGLLERALVVFATNTEVTLGAAAARTLTGAPEAAPSPTATTLALSSLLLPLTTPPPTPPPTPPVTPPLPYPPPTPLPYRLPHPHLPHHLQVRQNQALACQKGRPKQDKTRLNQSLVDIKA